AEALPEERGGLGREPGHELAALVTLVYLGLDAGAGRVGADVDVGDQADRRPGAWQRREDVALLGQLDLLEPEALELVAQEAREVDLPLGARPRVGVGALRVDADVAQEALERAGLELVREAQAPRPER